MIIDALKNKYSLPDLLKKLNLAKSSYYYQEKTIYAEDKYSNLRKRIIQLFHENRDIFGYRRIHMLLHREGIKVSEKSGSSYYEAGKTNYQTKTQTEI